MQNENESEVIEMVSPHVLLFLTKTPSLKVFEWDVSTNIITLTAEMNDIKIIVGCKFKETEHARDFDRRCIEWLNY